MRRNHLVSLTIAGSLIALIVASSISEPALAADKLARNPSMLYLISWSGQPTIFNRVAVLSLFGNHISLACTQCHVSSVFNGRPTACVKCHAAINFHTSQFGTECSQCHMPSGWKDVAFNHSKTALPLTGAHQEVSCRLCHLNGIYHGTPTDCASCHAEPAFHAGAFGKDCVACHSTASWMPAAHSGVHVARHGENLLQHYGATCKTCHTFVVRDFTCLACHDSKHGEASASHRD